MSAPPCPPPRPPVEVLSFLVHPLGPCRGEEEAADKLDQEYRAHLVTYTVLAEATALLEQLQPVLGAVTRVLAIHAFAGQDLADPEVLRHLREALDQLLSAFSAVSLSGAPAPASTPPSPEVSHG